MANRLPDNPTDLARYQAVIEYDGSAFWGFQRQIAGRTVQSEFEDALRRVGWQGKSILAAGRTDRGVHASGQVVAFDLGEWQHPAPDLFRALNAILPPDVAVKQLAECASRFHPRYAALARHYRYTIYHQPQRSPLADRYAWRVWPSLDLTALQTASAELLGTHDFATFGSDPDGGGNTIRTITLAEWRVPQPGWLTFDIQAEAFLFRMVRSIVGALKRVGAGQWTVADFQAALAAQDRRQCPAVAPPHGLCLMEVFYA